MEVMVQLQPEVIQWARETAGLSLEDAARRLGIKDGKAMAAQEKLYRLEKAGGPFSSSILKKMVKVYRRPMVALFLEKPPLRAETGEDFRTLPQRTTQDEPLVDALLRDMRARQEMVKSVLEDDETAPELQFVGASDIKDGVEKVLRSIEAELAISRDAYREQKSTELAFSYLRTRAEANGIFVVLAGSLGSHHSAIDVSAFRGFALADKLAPFVVINDQDAKQAWSFTLLHEIAHLWIGESGVSGAYGESEVERFCNEVASKFLLDDFELGALDLVGKDVGEMAERISGFANERLVSRSLVSYRLYLAGRLSFDRWQELSANFQREWREYLERKRALARTKVGGPNYFIVRRHKLGGALLGLVRSSLDEGALTITKAGKVLGVKPRSVASLLDLRRVA